VNATHGGDFLGAMAHGSAARVDAARARESTAALRARAAAALPAPALALNAGGFDLIAELKLRSPAHGVLGATDRDLEQRVTRYAQAGAAIVSVLTEPERFAGTLEHLARASATLAALGVPTLRKDFLVYAAMVSIYVVWRTLRSRAQPVGTALPDVLEVRDGARRHFVPLSDVVWVEAAGNYVELHRGGAGLLHRASLSEMHRRLQTAGFVRIHRSRLVRREAVADVESKPTGDFIVRLRDGRELAGSRRYRRPLLAD